MMPRLGISDFGALFWLVSGQTLGLVSCNGLDYHETQPSHCICVHYKLRT